MRVELVVGLDDVLEVADRALEGLHEGRPLLVHEVGDDVLLEAVLVHVLHGPTNPLQTPLPLAVARRDQRVLPLPVPAEDALLLLLDDRQVDLALRLLRLHRRVVARVRLPSDSTHPLPYISVDLSSCIVRQSLIRIDCFPVSFSSWKSYGCGTIFTSFLWYRLNVANAAIGEFG